MRLAIVSDEISKDFRKAVEYGMEWGITDYEIRTLTTGRVPYVANDEINLVKEVVKEHDLNISAISPGLFKIALNEEEQLKLQIEENIYESFRLADRLGTRNVIIFGFKCYEREPQSNYIQIVHILRRMASLFVAGRTDLGAGPGPSARRAGHRPPFCRYPKYRRAGDSARPESGRAVRRPYRGIAARPRGRSRHAGPSIDRRIDPAGFRLPGQRRQPPAVSGTAADHSAYAAARGHRRPGKWLRTSGLKTGRQLWQSGNFARFLDRAWGGKFAYPGAVKMPMTIDFAKTLHCLAKAKLNSAWAQKAVPTGLDRH